MTDRLQNIAIIGGGLTGPTLALSLKKQGIPSTIYELHEEEYKTGGHIVLASNALRVLDHVGVYRRLQNQGYHYEWLKLFNQYGKELGSMPTGNISLYQYPSVRLGRPEIRKELLDECKSEGIKIVYGKRLIGLTEDDEEVTLRFGDGTEEKASMAIGADGPHSRMRKEVAPSCNPSYSGYTVTYGMMPRSVFNKHLDGRRQTLSEPAMIFGKEGSFCAVPLGRDAEHVGFFGSFALEDRSREEWNALVSDKEALRELLVKQYCQGNWDKDVEILCRETKGEDFSSWPTLLSPELENWSSPSGLIVLSGDAAHAIPPAAAQGAAMGFEDAETLAYVLGYYKMQNEKETKEGYKLKDFLKKWEIHRKERIVAVLAFTNLLVKLRTPSSYQVLQYLKEWFITILFKIKGAEGFRWLYAYDGSSEVVKKALVGE